MELETRQANGEQTENGGPPNGVAMPEGNELKLSESEEAGSATHTPDQPRKQSKEEIKMQQFKSQARLGK